MGALPIVLVILAMKIPILGLLWFLWWAGRMHDQPEPEKEVRRVPPRRPGPQRSRGPRRRGPHGGGAVAPAPSRRRDHVAVTARAKTARSG